MAFEKEMHASDNFWFPFANCHEFRYARIFTQSSMSESLIEQQFSEGIYGNGFSPWPDLESYDCRFRSIHLYKKTMQLIDNRFGASEWSRVKTKFHNLPDIPEVEIWYREPLNVIKALLNQEGFEKDYIWEPIKEFDEHGEQVYTELHTTSWWWDMQASTFL